MLRAEIPTVFVGIVRFFDFVPRFPMGKGFGQIGNFLQTVRVIRSRKMLAECDESATWPGATISRV